MRKKFLLGLGQVGSYRHFWLLLVVVIVFAALPAMAFAKQPPKMIRPCTAEVTTDCTVIPPVTPEARQGPTQQPQAHAAPPSPPTPQSQPAPPGPGPRPPIRLAQFWGPGFYVGPEGFQVGPLVVPNPNYAPWAGPGVVVVPPPPPTIVIPPPNPGVAPGIAPGGFNCITAAYDGFVQVRTIPNGPVIFVFSNGVGVLGIDQIQDAWGYPWTRVVSGQITGWSRSTSLNCGGY